MTKTMQLVLAMAITASPVVWAQQVEVQPANGGDSAVAAQFVEVAQATGNQAKDSLFDDTSKFAKGATEISEIDLDPKTMGLVPGGYAGELAHRMKFMVIHNYTYDRPGMYNMDDVDAYRRKLNDGTWSCSIHVRNKDGATDICSRTAPGGNGSEMVIISAEPKELSFIHMSGNVSLGDLERSSGANLNLDLNHSNDAAAKASAARAKANADAEAQIRAVEAQTRAEEAKTRDAEAKAVDAEAKARDAQAKAKVAMKNKRTFRLGSMSYSSESSTPVTASSAPASSTGSPAAGSSKPVSSDSSTSSGSNTAVPPAAPPASSAPAK